MHIAVFVLALVGGLVDFFAAVGLWFATAALNSLAQGLGVKATEVTVPPVAVSIAVGFAAAVATIVAGLAVLARKAPRRWALVLLGANVVIVGGGLWYLFGAVSGLVAGLLAFRVRPSGESSG